MTLISVIGSEMLGRCSLVSDSTSLTQMVRASFTIIIYVFLASLALGHYVELVTLNSDAEIVMLCNAFRPLMVGCKVSLLFFFA